jgi:hypothetical protein
MNIQQKTINCFYKKQHSDIEIANYSKLDNEDTIVNMSCICSKYFYANEKILYILPCCHIIHEKCFNSHILNFLYRNFNNKLNQLNVDNNNSQIIIKCPSCNHMINNVLTEYKINSKKKYHQYKIDIKSIRLDNSGQINYINLPLGMVKFTSFINNAIISNSEADYLKTLEYGLHLINTKINIIDNTKNNPITIIKNKIYWINPEDINRKIVIISNHSHYLDALVIYYLFRCGFVASEFVNNSDIGRLFATKLKLLIFKRGVDVNMVDKIKEYLKEYKKITIFPEGAMSNNETLMRFRTGAFYIGEAICPIVIKYDKIIYDDDMKKMLLKLITQNEIKINVYINDLAYPPFNDTKINDVRNKMIKIGNFENSRVSNKSVKE